MEDEEVLKSETGTKRNVRKYRDVMKKDYLFWAVRFPELFLQQSLLSLLEPFLSQEPQLPPGELLEDPGYSSATHKSRL